MLRLDANEQKAVWAELTRILNDYDASVEAGPVTPELDPDKIRALLVQYDFAAPLPAVEALHVAANGLWKYQVHTPHPMYYGLFNPASTTMGIVADALVAGFNPQLAAWSHSPFAVEVEQHLVREIGSRFGYSPGSVDGVFASGGMEANHTAILTALTHGFPEFPAKGLRALTAQPVFYVSS